MKLEPGQAVKVRVRDGGERDRYFVRCLPADFPEYSFDRASRPASELYVVAPAQTDTAPNYVLILDRRGVPVWWYRDAHLSLDAKVLEDGTIAWARDRLETDDPGYSFTDGYSIRRPDGSEIRTLSVVGAPTDPHDLQSTRDGNYLVLAYVRRPGTVDASAYNGDSAAVIEDAVVQKVSPDGDLLWRWRSKDHIALAETGRWWERSRSPTTWPISTRSRRQPMAIT